MNAERPIEKLLRRFAKKRRDEAGTPAELHPANRRALQAEVARQFPKAQPRTGWWAGLNLLLNRKLAYAAAMVVVIAAGLMLLPTTKKHEPMGLAALDAKQAAGSALPGKLMDEAIPTPGTVTREAKDGFTAEPTVAAAPVVAGTESDSPGAERVNAASGINSATPKSAPLALAPASRPRSTPNFTAEADRAAVRRQQVAESVARYNEQTGERAPARADALAMPPPVDRAISTSAAELATSGGVTTNGMESSEVFARRYGVGRSAPMPGSIPSAHPAMAGNAKVELAKSVQNFSQVPAGDQPRPGAAAATTLPVLVNFVVEQSGDQIRMTDSDGSTYTGLVLFATPENVAQKEYFARGGGLENSAQNRVSPGAVTTDSQATDALNDPSFAFKVSGTNRTLRQQVNFVGNFMALTNQAANAYDSSQFADKAKNTQNQWNVAPLLQNSVIRGQLQIGAGREMPLNAVPAQK